MQERKIDFLSYLELADNFFTKLSDILNQILKEPPLVRSLDSSGEFDKAYELYRRKVEDALKGFESSIITELKQLDSELERINTTPKMELKVDEANAFINSINANLISIQASIKNLNYVINNTHKTPESGQVNKLNEIIL